jgi:hypothetical protein
VGALVKRQVELNVKGLWALITSMWLWQKNEEASEVQSFHRHMSTIHVISKHSSKKESRHESAYPKGSQ